MNKSIMIAGASGLVGRETLSALLDSRHVDTVYALSRRELNTQHKKLIQLIDNNLSVSVSALDSFVLPVVGVIAIGSTIKKAGTKEKLREIDVDLVASTAKNMKKLGVKHLIVVSCLGADIKARSHYLRCKGEMEAKVELLDFEKTTFLHPGPLAGDRVENRNDEKIIQGVLKVLKPLMLGRMKKYIPIQASSIAECILAHSISPTSEKVERLDCSGSTNTGH
ncbi:nucleoside-diphosphate sugar epimerase [Vibrio sp. UCD-FRSSP16_10]|uniref:NAD(P)H-binding protein n=1 Tax=unclassified Vibrio TaxID=2614977 RepID=UPI00080212B5|nr:MULTISPECIES: NAD(P)H-binding protein [unclassified Vibrio]OBT13284.1 nucleoside-diphosphate sugar epimerase [Vibrio sp. UCD-FRSSP16_30]OBT19634.1 nucleoside-diphosphate sugar epimerase [Vibrio sp. UCD-FRSSP16_10]